MGGIRTRKWEGRTEGGREGKVSDFNKSKTQVVAVGEVAAA